MKVKAVKLPSLLEGEVLVAEDEKRTTRLLMAIGLTILDASRKLLPGESVSLFSQELKKLLDHVMHEMSERWDNRMFRMLNATIGQTNQLDKLINILNTQVLI